MKKLSPRLILLAAVLCASLFYSCSSDVEILPPPPPAANTSSASEQVWSYCVFATMCLNGPVSSCPSGGTPSNDCPFSAPSSSSLGGNATASSSSISGQSSSGAAEYAYCVFATEKMCLNGPVSSCPPGGTPSNDCPYGSSSSVYSSSSTPSNSSVGTTYYCDFGLRETCPLCENGVGGGCFELENQYGECDSRYGKVTTSCSTGLVCDWGYRYYDSSHSDCGNDYCGGCYVIGPGSGITVASCEEKKGTVRSECPQSSLVIGTKPSSSSKPAGVSSSSVRPSSSSARPSSSSSGECKVKALLNDYCPPGTTWPDGIKWNQVPPSGNTSTTACYYVTSIRTFDINNWNQTLFKINGRTVTAQVNNNNLIGNYEKVDDGYYIYYASQNNYSTIDMTSGKPACVGRSSDEDLYCSGANTIITANNANTTNAVCFKITGNIGGWSTFNASERKCRVNNGAEVNADAGGGSSTQPAASAINGYVYINCSAGTYSTFAIATWQ